MRYLELSTISPSSYLKKKITLAVDDVWKLHATKLIETRLGQSQILYSGDTDT